MRGKVGWLALGLTVAVIGCAAPATVTVPPPTTQPTPTLTPTATVEATVPQPPPTVRATATAQASPPAASGQPADPDVLVSRLYPYSIRWPAEEQLSAWRPASAAWDGTTRIDNGNQYTDWIQTTQGNLFAFGVATDDSAVEFEELIAGQAAQSHGCAEQPTSSEQLTASGAEGILAEYRCGTSQVFRWVGIDDGFGLAVILLVGPSADPEAARARFAASLEQLIWRV